MVLFSFIHDMKIPNSLSPFCVHCFDEVSLPPFLQINSEQMMHGPCGEEHPAAPCMVLDKSLPHKKACSKNFPKKFNDSTRDADGYPEYRRRNNGATVTKSVIVDHRRTSVELDKRHVVPYNMCLCKKYRIT